MKYSEMHRLPRTHKGDYIVIAVGAVLMLVLLGSMLNVRLCNQMMDMLIGGVR